MFLIKETITLPTINTANTAMDITNAASIFTVTANAEHDGLIEAVERPDLKFCMGVQWHPERMGKNHDILYSELVKSARR